MHLLLILCDFEKNILLISQNIYLHRIRCAHISEESRASIVWCGGREGEGEGDERDTSSHVLDRE